MVGASGDFTITSGVVFRRIDDPRDEEARVIWLAKQSLFTVLVMALGGVLILGAAPGQAQSEEGTKLPTKRIVEILTIEVKTSARENWTVEKLDAASGRVYQRDTSAEEKKLSEWKAENTVARGAKYPRFFCFKAAAPGEATIVLLWKEVNTGKQETFRYQGKVEPSGVR